MTLQEMNFRFLKTQKFMAGAPVNGEAKPEDACRAKLGDASVSRVYCGEEVVLLC